MRPGLVAQEHFMNKFPIFLLAAVAVAPAMGFAQGALKSPWRESVSVPPTSEVNPTLFQLNEYRSQSLNMSLIRTQVANAAKDRFGRVTGKPVSVMIPRADGTSSRFLITEFNL
ncbi:MAG: hypothetical protein K8R88_03475, partial [Armatimonadetes bacterium]|nr:hypothetical protein [Armatimonadota bacterium]